MTLERDKTDRRVAIGALLSVAIAVLCFSVGAYSLLQCHLNYYVNNGIAIGAVLTVGAVFGPCLVILVPRQYSHMAIFILQIVVLVLAGFSAIISGISGLACEHWGWGNGLEPWLSNSTIITDRKCLSAYLGAERCPIAVAILPDDDDSVFNYVNARHNNIAGNAVLLICGLLTVALHIWSTEKTQYSMTATRLMNIISSCPAPVNDHYPLVGSMSYTSTTTSLWTFRSRNHDMSDHYDPPPLLRSSLQDYARSYSGSLPLRLTGE